MAVESAELLDYRQLHREIKRRRRAQLQITLDSSQGRFGFAYARDERGIVRHHPGRLLSVRPAMATAHVCFELRRA